MSNESQSARPPASRERNIGLIVYVNCFVGLPVSALAGFAAGAFLEVGTINAPLLLIGGIAGSILAVQTWFLYSNARSPAGTGLFIAVCLAPAAVFYPVAARSMCGAHSIKIGTELRALALAVQNELEATGRLPSSFGLFAAEHDLDWVWTSGPCRCDDVSKVKVGGLTLADYREGRATLDDLRREAAANPPGEIETHGSVTMWRNQTAWANHLIIAIRKAPGTAWDNRDQTVWGDMSVRVMDPAEAQAAIDGAAAAGTPYPQELIDLLISPVPQR